MGLNDTIRFLEYQRPPLRAGDYTVTFTQQPDELKEEKAELGFSVGGDRWTLTQGLVREVFPPDKSSGPWYRVLPHINLTRGTFPWERSPHGAGHEEPLTPSWVALLLFAGEEIPEIRQVTAAELESDQPAKDNLAPWVAPPTEIVRDPDLRAIVIDVPWKTLRAQLPSYQDLGVCAHSRLVGDAPDPDKDAMAARAIVVGQRLCPPGKWIRNEAAKTARAESSHCAAHLVTLEHRYVRETEAAAMPESAVSAPLNAAWQQLKDKVEDHEKALAEGGPQAEEAGAWLRRMEAELQVSTGKEIELYAPLEDTFPPPPDSFYEAAKKLTAIRGTMETGDLVELRISRPTILTADGRREECDEVAAEWLPKGTPAPEGQTYSPLPTEIAAVLQSGPKTAGKARFWSGMRPVFLLRKELADTVPVDADRLEKILAAVLPDPLWRETLKSRGDIRCERWWTFDGIPRRLAIEATEDAEGIVLSLVLTSQAQRRFEHHGVSDETLVRLVSLHRWTFSCEPVDPLPDGYTLEGEETGRHFAQRAMRLVKADEDACLRIPPVADPGETLHPEAAARLHAGYAPIQHFLRSGETTVSWYRGPLVPQLAPDPPEPALPASCADALLLYDSSSGMFDTSWAAAWELGRQLAIADRKFSFALVRWKQTHREQQYALRRQLDMRYLSIAQPSPIDSGMPAEVLDWMEALARLEPVPFPYLVPDERMLPAESLRFFTLDPAWVEALRDGALSIGRVHGSDFASDAIYREELPPMLNFSGVIVRSSIVKDWPSLTVRGFVQTGRDPEWHKAGELGRLPGYTELDQVRSVRLSQDILLVMFRDPQSGDDLNMLDIHVPAEALHFGLEGTPNAWRKDLRDGGKLMSFRTRTAMPDEPVIEAQLSDAALSALDAAADLKGNLKAGGRTWPGAENRSARAVMEEAVRKMDATVTTEILDRIWNATDKTVEEKIPVRPGEGGVLDFEALFQILAARIRPVVSGRAVTTADFALQMIDAQPVVRINRAAGQETGQ